ncbi:MAG: ABC transporter permease [Candidatus Aminicenantaceae bacterium]
MNKAQGKRPSRFGIWLLGRILSRRKNYGFFGDMEELYAYQREEKGRFRADLWFWAQILRTIPHYLLDSCYWSWIMFQNYFKVTFRSLKRHRAYSFINFAGLAVGMACCILILTYVHWELSYDRYHEESDRIFRLAVNGDINDRAFNIACVNNPPGPYLAQEWPEVEAAARIRPRYRCAVTFGDKRFFEEGVMWADASVFEVFSFPLKTGVPTTALKNPYTAVITASTALRYYGVENPLGNILRIDDQADYTITAVMEDVPENSHFSFDMLLSNETRYVNNKALMDRWMGDFNNYTYLLLRPGVDPAELEARFPALIDRQMGRILKAVGGEITYILQPLTAIHLHSRLEGEIAPVSDITSVYLFSCVAIFILLLACINFMNLATARSANRAREVGMRKVHGAVRSKLVCQFLGESMIYSFASLAIALLLVEAVLPLFRSLSERQLHVPYFGVGWLIPALLGLAFLVGLAAGSYPAFYLARFQPSQVLKSGFAEGRRKSRFRQVLVTFQFAVSTMLIIGTAVILSQVTYMKTKRLGFDKERVIVVRITNDQMQDALEPIQQEMRMVPGVMSVAESSHVPGWGARRNVCLPEGFSPDESVMMGIIGVDADFIPALGIELASGRSFSNEFPSDPDTSVLINETAARRFGWDEPLGKKIQEGDDRMVLKTVVGVIKDYHFTSLHNTIEPLLITNTRDDHEALIIKLSPGDLPAVLGNLQAKWESIVPGLPFDHYFLDQEFADQYRAEERLSRIFAYFSLLAIFIACLGLFGIAAYTAERRTKEIGIRKVLGASSGRLMLQLNREFAVLVILANLAAWPLVYWFSRRWLEDFAYRTSLHLSTFLLCGLAVFTIGILTVSYQSLKAAHADPVDSLKYE